MKRYQWLSAVLALLCLTGCVSHKDPAQTDNTTLSPETSLSTEAAETTVPETTAPEETAQSPTLPPDGWQEDADGKRYYRGGTALTGWQEIDGLTYYFRADGRLAQGKLTIDGKDHFFTTAGQQIILVNPWNFLPEDYAPDLVALPSALSTSGGRVDRSCYDALVQMLNDCNKECPKACVVSTYRTYEYQVGLFDKKVNYYINQGYSMDKAAELAATVIAIPGTSEHQTGLAVDIVDTRSWSLTEEQAGLPAQKWLMENCWKYGFILRYPADKTEVTGIIYEPWHYRYVGTAVAAELHESGQTLEEYMDSLTK